MLRRDFIRLVAASIATASTINPVAALCDSVGRKDIPLDRFHALSLTRDGQSLNLDISTPEGYFAACHLLRDVSAGQIAKVHPWLLHTLAATQAMITRKYSHQPFIINSGYRTLHTNRKVGGAKRSFHMINEHGFFHAADVHCKNVPSSVIADYALLIQQGGVCAYRRHGFVHIDVGPPRRWSDV